MHAATMRAVVTRPAAIPEREKEATKYESSSGTGGTGMAPCDFALAVTSALSPQPDGRGICFGIFATRSQNSLRWLD